MGSVTQIRVNWLFWSSVNDVRPVNTIFINFCIRQRSNFLNKTPLNLPPPYAIYQTLYEDFYREQIPMPPVLTTSSRGLSILHFNSSCRRNTVMYSIFSRSVGLGRSRYTIHRYPLLRCPCYVCVAWWFEELCEMDHCSRLGIFFVHPADASATNHEAISNLCSFFSTFWALRGN